jgi:hypothetical protein
MLRMMVESRRRGWPMKSSGTVETALPDLLVTKVADLRGMTLEHLNAEAIRTGRRVRRPDDDEDMGRVAVAAFNASL